MSLVFPALYLKATANLNNPGHKYVCSVIQSMHVANVDSAHNNMHDLNVA